MGRGRQKAKQTKVARELKYYSPDTNYRALEQELTSTTSHTDLVTETRRAPASGDDDSDGVDDFAQWSDVR